jgi:hypothetical protein
MLLGMVAEVPEYRVLEAEIPGFPGFLVMSYGAVVSVKRGYPRILKQTSSERGYRHVKIKREDGKTVSCAVHRLVAKAFIPNPASLLQVDHIDGDPSNNCVENLRWASMRDNARYAREQREKWLTDEGRPFSILRIDHNGNHVKFENFTAVVKSLAKDAAERGEIAPEPFLIRLFIKRGLRTGYPHAFGYTWRNLCAKRTHKQLMQDREAFRKGMTPKFEKIRSADIPEVAPAVVAVGPNTLDLNQFARFLGLHTVE